MTQFGKTRDNICNGIASINEILGEVQEIIANNRSPYYDTPRYVFRGITKYYPSKAEPQKKHYSVEDVEDGYIRSSQAVRMETTSEKYDLEKAYIRANYLSGLHEMVSNARKHYPDKYTKDFTELDILADIQHNGGATCLVDFSKNILTALWFSCSEDPFDDGFIYCYDVMKDMIENDALEYVRPEVEDQPIYNLLYDTHRETNISSNIEARFYLWEPSPKNTRILRQDSIFMFGIERFHVKTHGIKVVKVPAEQKQNILLAMKSLYNISSSTIYNDTIGFAINNSKKKLCQKMYDTAFNRGYINMIKGNYYCALDFLKLWEGDHEKDLTDEEKVELHFSLAVCYKKLGKTEDAPIYYSENAKAEYNKVIHYIRHILNNLPKTNQESRAYYKRKCTRAFNGIIDMEYSSGNYLEAIEISDIIINEINSGILLPDTPNNDEETIKKIKALSPKYCRITKMEMLDLEILTNWDIYENGEDNNWRKKMGDKMEEFYQDAIKQDGNAYFDKLLIEYYKVIFDILISSIPVSLLDYMRHFVTWFSNPQQPCGNNIYDGYIMWNFNDIKDAIHQVLSPELCKKKSVLLDITAYAISFRDKFQMQSWGRSDNM